MKKSVISVSIGIAIILSACASQPKDNSLIDNVRRKAPGTYSVYAAEIGSSSAMDEATTKALSQCQLDGNKKLSILTTNRELHKLSGLMYLNLFFRCE